MNLWKACQTSLQPQTLHENAWRLVELQAQSSTRVLVSSAKAQDRLETLLDKHKPTIQLYPEEQHCRELHYLLLTPFRYPPLPFGSRFGSPYDRGIFYGSTKPETAAIEKAFYRLFFARGSKGKIGYKNIVYTAFKASIKTENGLFLTQLPFSQYKGKISSKVSYTDSQRLGALIRKTGIVAFTSLSARSLQPDVNINVLSPLAFSPTQDIQKTFDEWSCFYTKTHVELYSKKDPTHTRLVLNEEDFLVNGDFPSPPA